MSVVRVNKTSDFTTVNNTYLRDKNMSTSAKGLLTVVLSLPPDWDYSVNGLVAICKEGLRATKTTMRELEQLGYLKISKIMPQKGNNKFTYQYDFFEKSIKLEGVYNEEVQSVHLHSVHLHDVAIQNSHQLSTKELSTKELSTNNKVLCSANAENVPKNVPVVEIINYLNKTCGTSYKHTSDATKKMINARLNNGFTVDDFKTVIDKKFKEWGNDAKMSVYLRPQTLFKPSHFESYLNQKEVRYGIDKYESGGNATGNTFESVDM